MSKKKGDSKGSGQLDGFTDGEMQESHAGAANSGSGLFLPFFLFLVACTWFTWGGIEISADANGFALHPDREMTQEELAAFEIRKKKRAQQGTYETYCATCHHPSGDGTPLAQPPVPPLNGSEWISSGERVASIIYGGLRGKIEVKGRIYDHPQGMQAIGKDPGLTVEQVALIINYVRGSWTNAEKEYPEVTVEQVEQAKSALGDRSTPWTPEELLEKYPFGETGD